MDQLQLTLAAAQEAAAEMCLRTKSPVIVIDIPGTCWFTVIKEGTPLPDGVAYRQRMHPWAAR